MSLQATVVGLLLLAAVPTLRAANLRGVILANEMGGAPLSNVEVSAVAGANASVTDDQGRFGLEFATRQPGDMVQLVVRKGGYVVINDFQLRMALPRDPDAEPVILLICKEDVREEQARRYYRLKSFEAIEAHYKKQLQELKARGEATAAELVKLQQERNQAEAVAEKAAAELARVTPTDTSEVYQQAMQLYFVGKAEEALQVLDFGKLRQAAEVALDEQTQAEARAFQAIQALCLRAQLQTLQADFTGSRSTYEKVVNLSKKSGRQLLTADSLSNLGYIRKITGQLTLSTEAFQEALAIYRALEAAAPGLPEYRLVIALNNLAMAHLAEGKVDSAMALLTEARKRQVGMNSSELSPKARKTREATPDLGDAKGMAMSRARYVKELKRVGSVNQLSEQSLLDLATTLGNLAMVYVTLGKPADANEAYDEALKIRRKLAEANPDAYLPDVAMTLNSLGILHGDQNWMEEARQAFEEALKIYEALAKKSPERYQSSMEEVQERLKRLDAKPDPGK